MPSLAIRLVVTAAWLVVGLLIGRRSRIAGTAVVWYAVLGPLGLLLVGFGAWRRHRLGPVPVLGTGGPATPVQVDVEGTWRDGMLETFTTAGGRWRAWVSYTDETGERTEWFSEDKVRRDPRAGGPADAWPT